MSLDLSSLEPSAENAQKYFPANYIGPTWARNDDGSWVLPELTLGWQIAQWCSDWLKHPTETDENGNDVPWEFTYEQLRFILWAYAIDESGEFLYQKLFLQRLKGWGKDPIAAVITLVELIGPSQFSHWDDDGSPVGKVRPGAYVQLAAVSLGQTENTRDMYPAILPKGTIQHFGLDVQKEIIYAPGGRKIKAVAANPKSLEGGRVSMLVANEPHHWTPTNGGRKFYQTASRNLAKVGGRLLVITNAFEPGEESVAEVIRNAQEKYWAGQALSSDWLYDSIEAPDNAPCTPEWAPFIVDQIKGDAHWLSTEKIVAEMQDPSIPLSEHRRFWYNAIVTAEDSFFSMSEWDGAKAESTSGTVDDLRKGDEIVLGFDGGKTDDATALVAIRIKDRLMVPLLVEQKPDGPLGENWEVDRILVDEAVRRAFADFTVRAFFADVNLWESYIMEWSETYREVLAVRATDKSSVGWDMRGSREVISRGWEAFYGAIKDGSIKHNGDKILRVHALNAKRGHNGKGLIARKENPESPRKIDVMVAGYVAFMALSRYLEKGKRPQKQYKRRMMQG